MKGIMKKRIEFRCSNILHKKGKEYRCGSFLFEYSPNIIKVVCRKCGVLYIVTKDVVGNLVVKGIEKNNDLIREDKKEQENGSNN